MSVRVKNVKDRRIQKTQELLRRALVSLLAEKPYDAIVVKEILDRANVGRSTFYMHFRDKDDLLVSGIHDMLRPVHSLEPPPSAKLHERVLWFSLPIFEYHYLHRHTGADRIGSRGRAILHDHLRNVLANVIAAAVKSDVRARPRSPRAIPAELLSEYVASTFVLALNWWLDKKMFLPPREINDLFRQLVSPTLGSV